MRVVSNLWQWFKHKNKRAAQLGVALLLGGLFLFIAPQTHAQSSPVEKNNPTFNLDVSFADLEHKDLNLRGMYGFDAIWVPFQSNWIMTEPIVVEVTYFASPLLIRERSSLTVKANGNEVTSIRPVGDGLMHTFTAIVPASYLSSKGFSLQFQGLLHITEDQCEETNNPGQWLTIVDTTRLRSQPVLDTSPPDLANLLNHLNVATKMDTAAEIVFVLPEQPNDEVLTTAGKIAARLGTKVDKESLPFPVVTGNRLAQSMRQNANLILVGLPDDLPLLEELTAKMPARLTQSQGMPAFLTLDNKVAPADDGLIQIMRAPWNPVLSILMVSAGSEKGLAKAGDVFGDPFSYSALHGEFQFVSSLETGAEPLPGDPWLKETTTFVQLGERDRTISGVGVDDELYFFRRPAGWILDNGSKFTLNLSFSPVLNARESYVSAFLNEVFIGTIRIGEELENNTSATFDLPISKLNETVDGRRPQTLTLRLRISNQLHENECEQLHPEVAWTKISADSSFTTPHVYLSVPDLQAFPYPFVSDAGIHPVTIIAPPFPTPQTMALALSMAATLGRFSPTPMTLNIATADRVSAITHGDNHLIILGEREKQPLLQGDFGELLNVPGFTGKDGLYQALSRLDMGLVREAPSPWNAERVALLITSEHAAGLSNAANALILEGPPVDQPGAAMLVEESIILSETGVAGSTTKSRIIFRNANGEPGPDPGEVAREPNISSPEPYVVATMVLLLTVLGVFGTIRLSQFWAAKKA